MLGLEEYISFTWLLDDAERASRGGWVFDASTGLDPVFNAKDLRCVTLHACHCKTRAFMHLTVAPLPCVPMHASQDLLQLRSSNISACKLARPLHRLAALYTFPGPCWRRCCKQTIVHWVSTPPGTEFSFYVFALAQEHMRAHT